MNLKTFVNFFVLLALVVTSLTPVFSQGAEAATTATTATAAAASKQICIKRVKNLNNRGKVLANGSKQLLVHYQTANAGWKTKTATNRSIVATYQADPDLAAAAKALSGKIDAFQAAVKAYNASKLIYITERNAQVKSYKKFHANCSTKAGQSAARSKILALKDDQKTLKTKGDAVHAVYVAQVQSAILAMREARNNLATQHNLLVKTRQIQKSTPAEVAQLTSDPAKTDLGAAVDNSIDKSELGNDNGLDNPNDGLQTPNTQN
jgi:hypothetical protein